MTLLTEDWGYPVDMAELDPADPLVNTDSEYMFPMATIGYHILNGTQTVVLEEAVEYNGETFAAGPHEVAIDGRYWTDFDRNHPLEVRFEVGPGAAARVIVRTHGGGVTPGDSERILHRFVQADPSSAGVGLGLHVARGLARAHGGELSVRPAAVEGSEFVLELPTLGAWARPRTP